MAGNSGLQNAGTAYAYWSFPRSIYVTLLVLNNGVDVAFGKTTGAGGPEAADYPPSDEYYPPGTLVRPERFDAVRIRNHVAGSVAQYMIAARLVEDVPADVPLGASFDPTYITIDPTTGAVGALFTGGVQLPEQNIPPAGSVRNDSVTWLRSSDGSEVALLAAQFQSAISQHALTMEVDADLTDTMSIGILVSELGALGKSQIGIAGRDSSGAQVISKLLDSAGNSDFIQVITRPGNRQLVVHGGSSTVTWPGASRVTSNTTIPHSLGRTPSSVQVSALGTTNMEMSVVSADGTNIVVAGNTMDGSLPANGTSRSFYWLVFG